MGKNICIELEDGIYNVLNDLYDYKKMALAGIDVEAIGRYITERLLQEVGEIQKLNKIINLI